MRSTNLLKELQVAAPVVVFNQRALVLRHHKAREVQFAVAALVLGTIALCTEVVLVGALAVILGGFATHHNDRRRAVEAQR